MLIAWLMLTVAGQIFLSEEEPNRGWHFFGQNRDNCKSEMSNLLNGINRHLCISVILSASQRVLLEVSTGSNLRQNTLLIFAGFFCIPY